jgi:glycosyl transferase family 87
MALWRVHRDNLRVMNEPAAMRPPALENRRFRSLLLVLAGVPIGLFYLWGGLLQPIFLGGNLGDFQESYMRAARRLVAGSDPYDLCRTMGCLEPTGPQYVMPPPLAWLLQPFVSVDSHLVTVAAILVLNASLAVFVYSALRALRVSDWQLVVLLVLIAISFEPVIGNIDEGQVNLLLLALSGLWLWAWVTDRWWGGAALGIAVAVKLIQGPVGLLVLWRRRWLMAIAAAVAGLALWLVAAPQYLYEYLSSVFPAISQGTGLFENRSPGGTITRLFEPDSFLGAVRGSPPIARALTIAVALVAVAVTLAMLRSPLAGRTGKALEASAVVAMTPLVASYSWGTHLVLLLLPLLVLVTWCVRRRDWTVMALVFAGWVLIGLGHNLLQTLLLNGHTDLVVLRVLAETGVAGITVLWAASLVAVRREQRSAHVATP